MKKNIPIISLIAYLLLVALSSGIYYFRKNQTQDVPANIPQLSTDCPPDARMASSTWRTFSSNDRFSVDYPEVLIPRTQSRFISVAFRTKTNPFSNGPLGVDIIVYPISTWYNTDRVSGIKSYQCVGGPSIYANIFHGSKVYLIETIGMSQNDVERMMNSIKFLD